MLPLLSGTFDQAFPEPGPHPTLPLALNPVLARPLPTSTLSSRPVPSHPTQLSPGGAPPAHLSPGPPALRVHRLITDAITAVPVPRWHWHCGTSAAGPIPPHGVKKGWSKRSILEERRQSRGGGTRDSLRGRETRRRARHRARHEGLDRRERLSGWRVGGRKFRELVF